MHIPPFCPNSECALHQSAPSQRDWYVRDGHYRSALIHRRCSSTAPRTVSNDLFSVNYLDRQILKDLAEHTRQTVQFARNAVNQMERLAVYRAYHNYFKPISMRASAILSFLS